LPICCLLIIESILTGGGRAACYGSAPDAIEQEKLDHEQESFLAWPDFLLEGA
jgi:hypothetical protein